MATAPSSICPRFQPPEPMKINYPVSLFAALTLAIFPTASSFAQATTASAKPVKVEPVMKLEAFAVTGSFIKRIDEEKTLPLTTISEDDLKLMAVSTPMELFATLPEVSRVPVLETGNGGAGIRGDIATVSLRGIGSGNTLVLLNGRRLAPHPITGSEGSGPFLSVNVNVIPTAAISRIEVLRDGASSVYGTDASAGVINTILKRNVTGLELRARYATPSGGAGRETGGTASAGVTLNHGATSLMFIYDYLDRSEIKATDRAWSRTADQRKRAPAPWDGSTADNSTDLRSSYPLYGRFQIGSANANNVFTPATARPTGVTSTQVAANGQFFMVPVGSASRTWQATTPDSSLTSPVYGYFYDINADEFLLPASRRHNLYLSGDHKFSDRLSVFTDVTAYRADSHNQRENSRIDTLVDNNIMVGADNPYNPFGSRFYSTTGAPNGDGTPRLTGTPQQVLLNRITLADYAPRSINVRSTARRGVAGARGDLDGGWSWESALLYSVAETKDHEANSVRESQLRDALARTDGTAFNPFGTTFAILNGALTPNGARFTNPESVLAPIRGMFIHEGKTSLRSWDGRANGPLWHLPGGDLSVAAGGEFRHETWADYRDPESGVLTAADVVRLGLRTNLIGDNNYVQQSATANASASRDVSAAFAEVALPIFGARNQLTGFRSLEFSFAARYENYSDFGSTTKPKVGVAWRFNEWLMLRGSENRGFRAPNLPSLYQGDQQRSFQAVSDTYRFAVTNSIDDGTTARRLGLRQGNRNLRPENSETHTVGLVLDVPFLKGLSVSADWWQIKQTGAIALIDALTTVNDDSARLLAENAKQIAAGKTAAQIDLTAAGNPLVIRNAVTPADQATFAAFNTGKAAAQQRAVVGTIYRVVEPYINASGRDVMGMDFTVVYRFPKTQLGQFTAKTEASWSGRFDFSQSAAAAPLNQRWLDGNSKWRGNGSLTWRRSLWSAGVFANYIGGFRDSTLRSTTFTASYISSDGYYIVKDVLTYNLNVSRQFKSDNRWFGNSTVRLGVNNVFDQDPPFSNRSSQGYDSGTADPRGRVGYIEWTRKF
jgi:iron complex outermembrane receptor protein